MTKRVSTSKGIFGLSATQLKIMVPAVLATVLLGAAFAFILSRILIQPVIQDFTDQLEVTSEQVQDELEAVGREHASLFEGQQEESRFDRGIAARLPVDSNMTIVYAPSLDGVLCEKETLLVVAEEPLVEAIVSSTSSAILSQNGDLYLVSDIPSLLGDGAILSCINHVVDMVAASNTNEIAFFDPKMDLVYSSLGQAKGYPNVLPDDSFEMVDLDGERHAIYWSPLGNSVRNRFGLLGITTPYRSSTLFAANIANGSLFIGLMSLFGGLGAVFSYRLAKPIDKVVKGAHLLAEKEFDRPIAHINHDGAEQILQQLDVINAKTRQLDHVQKLLERYLGTDIANRILDGEERPGGRRVWATALFADIRDFTTLAEKANITELFDELSEYFTLMVEVVRNNGGVITNFGGDSILALFGAPYSTNNHALNAVIAAGTMMDRLELLNASRMAQNLQPLRIGIGVNTGEMYVGNLGSESRLEYTALGDCINAAKRLSDLSKEMPFYSIYVGKSSVEEIIELPNNWGLDDLGEIFVKGRQEPIPTYAVTPEESGVETLMISPRSLTGFSSLREV